MKLVTYKNAAARERLGLWHNEQVYDLADSAVEVGTSLPSSLLEFLAGGSAAMDTAREVETQLGDGGGINPNNIILMAPLPTPSSLRDAYAFRQHVATARKNRGAAMIPEFDHFPVFYFSNHHSIIGPGELTVESDHLCQFDFELEAAIIIGKPGKNIRAAAADEHIAGFTIMNDFSARQLQLEEMKLNLGPAKGKDFATAIGPWLVTPDELSERLVETQSGAKYDLQMTARHNGKLISDGNLKDMNWTFAEIIERASYGVELRPGDIIGSGTVGTGCYLELNGTGWRNAEALGESYEPVWLQPGDSIELEIELLGTLTNTIARAQEDYSISRK